MGKPEANTESDAPVHFRPTNWNARAVYRHGMEYTEGDQEQVDEYLAMLLGYRLDQLGEILGL